MTTPPHTNVSAPTADTSTDHVLVAAIEHAWKWFELHANQRMQFINHYMIAVAFLGTAYITALAAQKPLYFPAGMIAVISIGITLFFYFAERRVRRLIHDGERSISSLEAAITSRLCINYPAVDLKIAERADRTFTGEWKYSSVFGWMYCGFGIAAVNAAAYALTESHATWRWYVSATLLSLGAVLFAQTNFERKTGDQRERNETEESGSKGILGVLFLIAGAALALYQAIQ